MLSHRYSKGCPMHDLSSRQRRMPFRSSPPSISWTASPSPCGSRRERLPCPKASSQDSLPGPAGAFEPGMESASRQRLFNKIAPKYDELNSQLSFGQHWFWKQQTAKWSGAKAGDRVVDLCCGSGDLAFMLAKLVGMRGEVVGLDFAQEMLSDAAAREERERLKIPGLERFTTPMTWLQGDATALPFADEEFDAATMGYGLRNVDDRPGALRELRRILKPGSRAAVLDFNNSTNPTVDSAQAFFLERLVVPAARQYGLEAEYEYLRPSIKQFPTGREQEVMALEAGFKEAKHYELAWGLMGVLVCRR